VALNKVSDMDFFDRLPRSSVLRRPCDAAAPADPHVESFARHAGAGMAEIRDRWTLVRDAAPLARDGVFAPGPRLDAILRDRRAAHLESPLPFLSITLPSGAALVAPPYDRDWFLGAGVPLARLDGKLVTFGTEGDSTCGVGAFLDAEHDGLASVTPAGTWDYSWVSLETYPDLRSAGGLGVTVFEGSAASPLATRRATLWNIAGPGAFMSDMRSGSVADAVSSTTTFGPIPIAPLLFPVRAGTRYLFWVWAWQVAHFGTQSPGFLAFLRAHVPLLMIEAGPAPIVR
jgi:hypothetical protein